MPSNIPAAPKSQYEIERDERIKRNEAFMLSIGIDPHGGGYMKQNKKKAPPKPRLPRKKVPESERRRSSRARPERLTYDEWSDDERPRQRSRGSAGRRARNNRLVELSEEQRAALATFDMDDFEAFASASFTKPRHRRPERDHRFICTQVDGARRRAPHLRRQPAPGHPPGHEARVRRGRPLRLARVRLARRRHLPQGRARDDAVGRSAQSFPSLTPSTRQLAHRSDIGQIIEDARDFENTHGRDHGNGWLLNHPLRKLLFYQHYLDTKGKAKPAATTPTKAKRAKTNKCTA